MGMQRNHRFDAPFHIAFEKGLVLNGEVEPDNEFQQDRAAAPRQQVDERTGLRQWKAVFFGSGACEGVGGVGEGHFLG